MIEWIPPFVGYCPDLPQIGSAWRGLESILLPLIKEFNINPNECLEFGVEHGYSTAALASHFTFVTAVDTFQGDIHAGVGDADQTEAATRERLKKYDRVEIVRASYQDFIASDKPRAHYDLCHIDIVHTYEDTYACGKWAVERADCVVFHDTLSFPDVARAVEQLSKESGRTFYNYPECHGLGILREGR